jgi:DNA-binding LacI/PurR family transcriptional regulator
MSVTLEDIAKAAGVAVSTVSRALTNDKHPLNDKTRKRIVKLAQEMGYKPNASARSLRTQKTHLIAVMIPYLLDPFFSLLIRSAQQVLEKEGYHLLIYDTDHSPVREQIFTDVLLTRQVDGAILITSYLNDAAVEEILKANVCISTDAIWLTAPEIDVVCEDQVDTAKKAVNHLLALGHRRIAHITGSQDTPVGRARYLGYREALRDAGIAYQENLVRFGDFSTKGIFKRVESLMEQPIDKRPTAIFLANDYMAIETIKSLKRLGFRIPDDVAICGIDNIPEGTVVEPSLTTVDIDAQTIGRTHARLLLDRLRSDKPISGRRIITPSKLVVRDSTKS